MLTTGQSLDLRFVDFKTCTLNYKCGARQPIQNSNTATIQDFDLSSSCLVPRRARNIVSLLSRIVGCGTKLAGTTSSLASSLYIYAHSITELSISQARWTHSSDWKLLIYKLARYARQLRHILIPLRRNHSSTSVCFLDFSFLFCSARVRLSDVVVVAFREKISHQGGGKEIDKNFNIKLHSRVNVRRTREGLFLVIFLRKKGRELSVGENLFYSIQ